MDINFDRFGLPNAGNTGNIGKTNVNKGKTEKAEEAAVVEQPNIDLVQSSEKRLGEMSVADYNKRVLGINVPVGSEIEPLLLTVLSDVPFNPRLAYLSKIGRNGAEPTEQTLAMVTESVETLGTAGNIESARARGDLDILNRIFEIDENGPRLDDPASYFANIS